MQYKNFIVSLSSYRCDKNCPYCIAKMNKLSVVEENLDSLIINLEELKKENHTFKSCVISGNGEPSLYEFEFLKKLKRIMEEDMFKMKRIQSSGNLFLNDSKFELFKDWIIEVTRVSHDFKTDSKILKYKHDYMSTDNFKKANIRMNMVLLKNCEETLVKDINDYFKNSNIQTIALKMLDKYADTKQDAWIENNGFSYKEIDKIITILNNNFNYIGQEFQNKFWEVNDKKISLYCNDNYNNDKTYENFMWYGDKQLI